MLLIFPKNLATLSLPAELFDAAAGSVWTPPVVEERV